MKSAVFYGKEDIKVEERELRNLDDNEVQIRVAWSGLCGSELHEYVNGPVHFLAADTKVPVTGEPAPLNTGHEFSGIVEAIGPTVKNINIGDRVTVNGMLTPNATPEIIGVTSPASHADYVIAPEISVLKLPEALALDEAAVVEPAATAVQAIKVSELIIGDSVVVLGVGPIGLLTIIAAKAAGASNIIGIDLSETRLNKAKEVGATHTINSSEVDVIGAIKDILPEGADITFEVAGVEPTFKQAIQATKAGGRVVIVSVFTKDISWNPFELQQYGVSLTSTLAYTPETFRQTIDLMALGRLEVKNIITSRIPLEEIVPKGFEALINDKSQAKILIELSGEK